MWCSVGVVIIGQSAWSHASLSAGGLEPKMYSSPYTQTQMINILSRDCPQRPEDISLPGSFTFANVFRAFLEQIYSLYHDVVNDLQQFQYLAQQLFLFTCYQPNLTRLIQHIFQSQTKRDFKGGWKMLIDI